MDGRTALLGAACALLLLSGCGGGDAESAPAASPSPVASPAPLPTLTPSQRSELLGVLTSVVPGMTATDEQVVERATAVCQDIVDGEPPERVRSMARLRFQGGSSFSLGDEEGGSIVTAVESIWCKRPPGATPLSSPAASPS